MSWDSETNTAVLCRHHRWRGPARLDNDEQGHVRGRPGPSQHNHQPAGPVNVIGGHATTEHHWLLRAARAMSHMWHNALVNEPISFEFSRHDRFVRARRTLCTMPSRPRHCSRSRAALEEARSLCESSGSRIYTHTHMHIHAHAHAHAHFPYTHILLRSQHCCDRSFNPASGEYLSDQCRAEGSLSHMKALTFGSTALTIAMTC